MMMNEHAVAGTYGSDAVANRNDNAGRLMPENTRCFAFDVPGQGIGSAESAHFHAYDDLARPWFGHLGRLYANIPPRVQTRHSIHGRTATLIALRFKTRSSAWL